MWMHERKRTYKRKQGERKHYNSAFYTSKQWRSFRQGYINRLIEKQAAMTADLEVLNKLPVCESCLRHRLAIPDYPIFEGRELDHINPINPDDAYDESGRWGKAFDENNVQLLCSKHHAKKSARDTRIINLKRKQDESNT